MLYLHTKNKYLFIRFVIPLSNAQIYCYSTLVILLVEGKWEGALTIKVY